MRRLLVLFVLLGLFQHTRGQTVNRYRYWFDEDVSTLQEDVGSENMTLDLSVESLTGWFHQLHFQVCDTAGAWSPVQTKPFAIVQDEVDSRDVTGQPYRYWFDEMTTKIEEGTMSGNIMQLTIPTSDLTGWFHQFHFQVRDADGQWSPVQTKPFAIVQEEVDSRNVAGQPYRYWFDEMTTKAEEGTMSGNIMPLTISTSDLTGWFHQFHFQVRDADGQWSPVQTKPFAIVQEEVDSRNVAGQPYRYWFDEMTTKAEEGTMSGNIMPLTISTSDLTGWFHQLHFQVRDADGQWSPVQTKPFAIVKGAGDDRNMKGGRYRYWFDEDSTNVAKGVMSSNFIDLELPVLSLSDGDHILYFQVQEPSGWWSAPVMGQFSIVSHGLTIMTNEYGQVIYDGTMIRGDVANFDVHNGETISMQITADEGYALTSVMLNGTEEIKDQVTDGKLSLTVDASTAVVVTFDLSDYMKLGDVNDDNRISVADVAMTVDYLIGGKPSPFVRRQADANSDGEINVGDLARIVDFITGARARGDVKENKRKEKKEEGKEKSSFEDVLTGRLTAQGLDISLRNEVAYTTFQMALTLPEGTEVDDLKLSASRSDGHEVAYGWLDDGRLSVVVYSGDNSPLLGNDGKLLEMSLGVGADKVENVRVDDIVFVTTSGEVCKFAPFTINGQTDGIESPTTHPSLKEKGMAGALYDVGGRRIANSQAFKSKMPRGIYIIGGKKIIFK